MSGLPAPIRAAFARQADACRRLGSPFTADLCGLLAETLDPGASAFARSIADWPGDPGDDALALRACGALHALARSGDAPALSAAYPPNAPAGAVLAATIEATVAAYDARLTVWLDSPPQTNEPKRSGALLGALAILARETGGLPVDLLEIGASAGLNLCPDRYAYDLGPASRPGDPGVGVTIRCDWRGAAPDASTPIVVADRAGCDRNPLDPGSPEDRERLIAYVWADQSDRLATAAAALDAAAAAPWRVARADAAEWAESTLAARPVAGRATALVHTVVWQYLPAGTKARIETALAAAGARATPDAPLARIAMEPDERKGSAALTLTLWPGGGTRTLGRADFHGRWVEWGRAFSPDPSPASSGSRRSPPCDRPPARPRSP